VLTGTSIGARGLLADDPALPARDEHLDTAWVSARLAALTGRSVVPDRLVRSKYRIGESLRTVHRVSIDGTPATVTGRMFADGAASVARRAAGALFDEANQTVWWTFPDDRKLRDIAPVARADAHLGARLGIPTWASSTVAEYAPERSLTVRADDAHGRTIAYVKLYAPGSVALDRFVGRYQRAARAFGGVAGVSVPRVLGRSADAIAISPMPGGSWTAVAADEVHGVLRRLGAAIAHFHGIDPTDLAGPFGRLLVPRVVHSAELVAAARPDLADRLALVAGRLAGGPPAGDPQVLLHGDCHPKNSLVDGDRLALIDLDQAGIGSPACDIASLLARFDHGVVLGETNADAARRLGEAFLDGYASVRSLPSEASLRWHVAAALVAERAIRAVNRVNLRSLAALGELVDLTVTATAGLGPTSPREQHPTV
jgi:aminoglycoside phosphotransferase